MSRPSSIDTLPQEIREAIARLRAKSVTIDAILAHLRTLDVDVSRSSLGRHVKKLDQIGERIRRSREVADVLVRRLGDAPESRQARLNIELMHTAILDLLGGSEDGEAIAVDPETAMLLGRALKDLASAQKTDVEAQLRIRAEAMKEAAAAVDQVAKTRGLSAETVADLKSQFLGIGASSTRAKPA